MGKMLPRFDITKLRTKSLLTATSGYRSSTPTAYPLHHALCTLCTPLAYLLCVHRTHIVPYESIYCALTVCANCTLCMHSWCTYYAIIVYFGYSHFPLCTHSVHTVHSLFVHPKCTHYAPWVHLMYTHCA